MRERLTVAALSVVGTLLFWFEYLPPFRWMHLYSDIEGYHWPLLVAAFERIRRFELPLWDPSIYCGIPFAANIQASLFYPPTWLLFLANVRSRHLLFATLQLWVFLHAALAFYLCWLWLRQRGFGRFASLLGGAVFAFGGYMISQNNHVGVVTGYSWMPLAWMGVDRCARERSWRPAWMIAAASALCVLAGYPSSWLAFVAGIMIYGLATGWRAALSAAGGIAVSMLLAAVQLLPTWEASGLKEPDFRFGWGFTDPVFFLHLAVPDWVGFVRGDTYFYLYLGVPALFGAALAFHRANRAALAVIAACLVMLVNPLNLVGAAVARAGLLSQVVQTVNFMEPATLAFALLAASGVERFLPGRRLMPPAWMRRWAGPAVTVLLAGFAAWRLWLWLPGGPELGPRWWSAGATGVLLALFAGGLWLLRVETGRRAVVLMAALALAVFADYKANGTSRVFSGAEGNPDGFYPRAAVVGMNHAVFDRLRDHRDYRIAVDGFHATELRRFRLASPQGFDPLLPLQYKRFIEKYRPFETNRLFSIPPTDYSLMQMLGVAFYMTRDGMPSQPVLAKDPAYRLSGPPEFAQVFELLDPQPPWRWEGGEAQLNRTGWAPERRTFQVDAAAPGKVVLVEQFYPGWHAVVDGREAPLERWNGTFQAAAVPAGRHEVAFEYRPWTVPVGAAVSLVSLLGLVGLAWFTRSSRVLPPQGNAPSQG